MQTILLSSEEVAQQAMELYEAGIRETVEIDSNIGQMVIIDVETGAYQSLLINLIVRTNI
ncbi:hypothetical protein [Chamaesiphon sp. OTE_8_metabat_110]|uniref:hypothetical protein n=1 Tax=Chamaesiphon sp. OTE_8_metabat_110 TaxID=2964696 RepID=UPI00286B047E|nr:hypothetical protein [Chamaesiphon sp. OTE_8_metabat_110]